MLGHLSYITVMLGLANGDQYVVEADLNCVVPTISSLVLGRFRLIYMKATMTESTQLAT